MQKNVVIQEDNYTGTVTENYKKIGQEIDDVAAQYAAILRKLANDNMEGETAGQLAAFAEEVSRLLENMVQPQTAECAQKQVKFVEEIEILDKW